MKGFTFYFSLLVFSSLIYDDKFVECISCDEHYYSSGGQCKKCNYRCSNCESENKCTSCYPTFYLESYTCENCIHGCYQCSDSTTCSKCYDGFYLKNQDCYSCPSSCIKCSSNTVCNSCKTGYYLNSTKCEKCISPCTECSNPTSCTACDENYFLFENKCIPCSDHCVTRESDNCKCKVCDDGFFVSNYKCYKCSDPNCKSCSGSADNCQTCYDGYYLSYLSSNKSCLPCQSPCKTCSSDTICISCFDDYFLLSSVCYNCNVNCKTKENDNCKCKTCYYGYYLSNYQCLKCDSSCKTCSDSATKCEKCNEGYYLVSTTNTCEKCPNNCKVCTSSTKCTECNDGYFIQSNECFLCNVNCNTTIDGCKCNTCFDGYYLNNSQCLNCLDLKCKNCPGRYNKITIDETKCLDECRYDEIYRFEYKDICYEKCPDNTYIIENTKDFKCLEKAPSDYYLDLKSEMYKKCYESCKQCSNGGNKTIHNCDICIDDFIFYDKSKNNNFGNCFPKCDYYYYLDKLNEFHCNEICPEEYKIIIEKKKCIDICQNDEIYRYEYNNTCFQTCPNNTIQNESDFKCYDIAINDISTNILTKYNKIKNIIDNIIKDGKNETKEKTKEEEIEYYNKILKIIEELFTSENYDTTGLDNDKDEIIETEKMAVTLSKKNKQKKKIIIRQS